MPRHTCFSTFVLGMSLALLVNSAQAAPPADQLLPDTTRGFVSVADIDDLIERFEQTQIGQLVNDPIVKPFAEDLKRQLGDKLNRTDVRLGLRWEDLKGVSSGEIAVAVAQPDDEEQPHAMIFLVDATGNEEKAQELLDKIAVKLEEKEAEKSIVQMGGQDVVHYLVPEKDDPTRKHHVYYRLHQGHIVAVDHAGVMERILARFDEEQPEDVLAHVNSYGNAMQRCKQASGEILPQLRWFVDIFGYINTTRAAEESQREGKDFLELFVNQGFDAIRGAGGWLVVANGENEFTHHTWIDAPGDKEAVLAKIAEEKKLAEDGDPVDERIAAKETDKYLNAARLLDFPNSTELDPQPWVPTNTTSYISLNWKIPEAFEYAKTLVNEMLNAAPGEDLFEEIIDGIANDPNGPLVDVRNELIVNVLGRITLMTDYKLPVTPSSERWMAVIDVANGEMVEKAIAKLLEAEPSKRKHEFQGLTIWEKINEEEDIAIPDIQIDGGDPFSDDPFGEDPFGDPLEEEDAPPAQKPLLARLAVTVTKDGRLIVASEVDYIIDILKQDQDSLNVAGDFMRVNSALEKLGAESYSYRLFSRLDQSYHVNYEMLRQGKMAESKTLLGKLINRWMAPADGGPREQVIDGSKMPAYEKIAKYLGPSGTFVKSEENGWFLSGCVLARTGDGAMNIDQLAANEEEPAEKPEEEPAEKPKAEKPKAEKPKAEKPKAGKPKAEKPEAKPEADPAKPASASPGDRSAGR